MSKFLNQLNASLTQFIQSQRIFFVATAARDGRINLSPKGMDTLRVVSPQQVVWLNLTGSGNETAAHLLQYNRMTMMFCAFEGSPLILRIYGTAKACYEWDENYKKYIDLFPDQTGARQIIVVTIDNVQTSCGFGVPLMNYLQDRTELIQHAENKGRDKIRAYWKEKNVSSIDGFDTGICNKHL